MNDKQQAVIKTTELVNKITNYFDLHNIADFFVLRGFRQSDIDQLKLDEFWNL